MTKLNIKHFNYGVKLKMLINIIFGFIIPWVLASFMVRKQPILFIVISPVTIVISLLINTIGIYFGFWNFKPYFEKIETISALPFDFGLYAVLGSLLIYTLSKRPFRLHPVIIILIFSIITTVLEYMAFLFGFLTYGNGWNIGWTFISYSIAYLCVTTAWIIAKVHIKVVK
ncbi:CBO0543 family protein [Bacillus sp. FJAT-28004]|uniref:CBO0543 family protein n=1 Tax=Bacillus sp. FJAT-28004 TaxID=1679165 RepID=UPI0039C9E91A